MARSTGYFLKDVSLFAPPPHANAQAHGMWPLATFITIILTMHHCQPSTVPWTTRPTPWAPTTTPSSFHLDVPSPTAAAAALALLVALTLPEAATLAGRCTMLTTHSSSRGALSSPLGSPAPPECSAADCIPTPPEAASVPLAFGRAWLAVGHNRIEATCVTEPLHCLHAPSDGCWPSSKPSVQLHPPPQRTAALPIRGEYERRKATCSAAPPLSSASGARAFPVARAARGQGLGSRSVRVLPGTSETRPGLAAPLNETSVT